MKKKVLVSLVLVGTLTVGVAAASYAWFTSRATGTATIHAGNLALGTSINATIDNETVFSNNFNIPIKTDKVQPGDVLTVGTEGDGMAKITVKNTGNLPIATFGRFTLSGDENFARDMKITRYKVTFHNEDGTEKVFYYKGTNNTYTRVDDFINGSSAVSGMATNMYNWVHGYGPMDFMTADTPWDFEGLKPGEYYTMEFKLEYDENATAQQQNCTLGYEVKATQVNAKAIKALTLDNVPDSTIDSSVFSDIQNYVR